MSTITLGVDLAKNVFSVCAMDGAGHVLERREFKREVFAVWLAQRPAGTVVAMEACSGAHHAHTALPAEFKALIRSVEAHWTQVRTAFDARDDERCVRLRAIVGIGALTADALIASLGKAQEFRNGRQLAAWLGMVPTQHSSGGHTRLGAISCRGDGYLRTLLIQGARSSLQRAKVVATEKATPEQLWIRSLAVRLPFGKVLVAIANKHARQLWVMLAHEVDYDPCASQRHPMHRPAQLA